MANPPFKLPATFSGEVRLFPLSELVMFPGNLLPLHIFESRYREMLEDAVQGDQLIAMATLIPGHEHDYYCRPPVASAICIGRVTEYEKTPQGTYNLMLLGLQRAEIESEIEPVRAFRRARVKLLGATSPAGAEADRKLGLRLAARLRELLPAAEKLVAQFAQGGLSLATLTDVIAFHLPLPFELKLELLAEADVQVRADRLLASLPRPDVATPRDPRFNAEFSDN